MHDLISQPASRTALQFHCFPCNYEILQKRYATHFSLTFSFPDECLVSLSVYLSVCLSVCLYLYKSFPIKYDSYPICSFLLCYVWEDKWKDLTSEGDLILPLNGLDGCCWSHYRLLIRRKTEWKIGRERRNSHFILLDTFDNTHIQLEWAPVSY